MSEAAENKQTGEAAGAESPSMEEILKSIRGVISGEEAAEAAKSGEDDEVLELTEMAIESETVPAAVAENAAPVAEEGEQKSVLDDIDAALSEDPAKEETPAEAAPSAEEKPAEAEAAKADDVLEANTPEEKPAEVIEEKKEEAPATVAAEPAPAAESKAERLLKEDVMDKSAETLRSLVNNLPKAQISSPYTRGGTTLEELAIEAMKPFLAEWLNENLPTIVKNIVSKEVKKLIPQDDDK